MLWHVNFLINLIFTLVTRSIMAAVGRTLCTDQWWWKEDNGRLDTLNRWVCCLLMYQLLVNHVVHNAVNSFICAFRAEETDTAEAVFSAFCLRSWSDSRWTTRLASATSQRACVYHALRTSSTWWDYIYITYTTSGVYIFLKRTTWVNKLFAVLEVTRLWRKEFVSLLFLFISCSCCC